MPVKRELPSDSSEEITTPTPTTPPPSDDEKPTPKKKQRSSPTKGKSDQPKNTVRKWTPEEEVIFLEVIEGMINGGLWQAIRADGRLEYRGAPGIRAHSLALFKNLKKNGVNGSQG